MNIVRGVLLLLLCLPGILAGAAPCDGVSVVIEAVTPCLPPFHFRALGVPDGYTCLWKFTNGVTKEMPDFIEPISTPGENTVEITIKDQAGAPCTTFTKTFILNVPDPAVVTVSPQPICSANTPVTFTCLNAGSSAHKWLLTGPLKEGNPVTHTFGRAGGYPYTLTFTDKNGCYVDTTFDALVVNEEIAFSVKKPVYDSCPPSPSATAAVRFDLDMTSGASLATNIEWRFSDGQTLTGKDAFCSVNLPNGNYEVTVRCYAGVGAVGCVYERKLSFKIGFSYVAKPTISPTAPQRLCKGGILMFTNTTPDFDMKTGKWKWNLGKDTSNTTPAEAVFKAGAIGVQMVTLVYTESGCKVSSEPTKVEVVSTGYDFKVDVDSHRYICETPYTVHFKVAPHSNPGDGYSFFWTVFDAVTKQNLVKDDSTKEVDYEVTFPDMNKKYTVVMIVKGPAPDFCIDTITRKEYVIIVKPKTSITVGPTEVCANKGIKLKSSPELDKFPYVFVWEVMAEGDSVYREATSVGVKETTWTPTVPGRYRLRHLLKNKYNCPDTVYFDDWITVRGVAATAKAEADVYSGCHINGGFKAQLRLNVTANEPPDAPLTYQWSASAAGAVFKPSASVPEPELVITSGGAYGLSVRVSNGFCDTTIVIPDTFRIGLGVELKLLSKDPLLCPGAPFKFEAKTNFKQADSYEWLVGPNMSVGPTGPADATAAYTFATPGEHQVCVVAVVSDCRDTACITVQAPDFMPSATVTPDNFPCYPGIATFRADPNDGRAYTWITGAGDTLPTQDAVFTFIYRNIGEYQPSLSMEDRRGCKGEVQLPKVTVNGPRPNFKLPPEQIICDSGMVQFEFNTGGADTLVIDYGNGVEKIPDDQTPVLPEIYLKRRSYTFPIAEFPDDSVYFFKVRLVAKDDQQPPCQNEFSGLLPIYRSPKANFTFQAQNYCAPTEVLFTYTGRFADRFAWDFDGDGVTDSEEKNPLHTFPEGRKGGWPVRLSVFNKSCMKDTVLFAPILPLPEPAFEVSAEGLCPGDSLTVTDISTGDKLRTWAWDWGDGTKANGFFPLPHVYAKTGVYKVQLQVTNADGCSGAAPAVREITVSQPKAAFDADASPLPDIVYYPPAPNLTFTDASFGASRWLWVFSDSPDTVRERGPVQHLFPETETDRTVQLFIYDKNGCKDSTAHTYRFKEKFLLAPSVFTPNGDGQNEVFRVRYSGPDRVSLQIFDRFGVRLAQLNDDGATERGWDGTHNGASVPVGTYYFVLTIGPQTRTGHFVLLR